MAKKSLEERVNMLERRVEILEQLPERVTALEAQIVQLRDDMRAEFSVTRAEARAGDEHVVRTLREEIRAGDEETRRFVRMLHEEVIERIKLLGGQP
jgi:predicted phage gp36 major capsid-like protein